MSTLQDAKQKFKILQLSLTIEKSELLSKFAIDCARGLFAKRKITRKSFNEIILLITSMILRFNSFGYIRDRNLLNDVKILLLSMNWATMLGEIASMMKSTSWVTKKTKERPRVCICSSSHCSNFCSVFNWMIRLSNSLWCSEFLFINWRIPPRL